MGHPLVPRQDRIFPVWSSGQDRIFPLGRQSGQTSTGMTSKIGRRTPWLVMPLGIRGFEGICEIAAGRDKLLDPGIVIRTGPVVY